MNFNIYIKIIFQAVFISSYSLFPREFFTRMRFIASLFTAACILAVGDAASKTAASSSSQTAQRTHKQSSSSTRSTAFAPTGFTNTSSGACASVSVMIRRSPDEPIVAASTALECLKSVPLNVNRSISFIEFIEPYLQLQSTLAYLKNPPQGWLFPGVDVLGGLTQMKTLLLSGEYKTQWDFERDIWSLVNILPHDLHFNLPLPLISSVFEFAVRGGSLVSVSSDGLSLPKVFFKMDLDQTTKAKNATFTPSAIVKINGQDANTFLQKTSQSLSNFNDPDATYNQLFFSPAFNVSGGGNVFNVRQMLGFTSDFYNYTFENGTTKSLQNVAEALISFDGIDSGQSLFDALNPLPSTTTESAAASATSSVRITTTTSLVGYPTPIVIHRDGYVSGYFLPNSSVAVLVMQGFIDPAETDTDTPLLQSEVVASFLSSCRKHNKTKLIVDVQANGGGAVIEGYDTFQRILPSLEPFGASRMGNTEVGKFLGSVFTENLEIGGVPDANYEFEAQTYMDINGKPFSNWSALDPPDTIYNDTFTAQTRFVPEYFTSEIPRNGSLALGPQIFESKNIVLLYDGSCGSTCAVFSEFMKSQGGVRSGIANIPFTAVVMGGRPQTGPMQGVAGSKGSEVLTFSEIDSYLAQVLQTIANLTLNSLSIPSAPSTASTPLGAIAPWPLGDSTYQGANSRLNFRDNICQNDSSFTPLQFIYEASNCRLFYKEEDMYDMQGLWKRIENTVWGDGKCVEGSTTTGDGSFPSGAEDSVRYSSAVDSQVVVDSQPGLIAGSSETGGPPYRSANATTTIKSGYLAHTGSLTTTAVSISISSSANGGSGAKTTSSAGTSMATTAAAASASGTSIGSAVTAQFNGRATCVRETWWMLAFTAVVGGLLA
ncbi:putative peptidase s41 family protein [Botrytis fragariae]|uniref:Putative peptidase s41 family protein n=1 Tax=Botrytis fragariae TaxID=1964551 RepID=A0A8H6AN29_9HELO|nr:putative peptidase s41 family protein [Botrytis fragariae]KAF5870381.1 putative peptidase s41 family protein [Botrytis fragariae]